MRGLTLRHGLIGMGAVFFLLLACRTDTQRPSPAATAQATAGPPQTKEGCASCRGVWKRHGLIDQESCVCRTKDGGKPCRDGNDCQGQCLAEGARFEVTDKGPPVRGFFVGRCSELEATFGCFAYIPKGARAAGPVLATDQPAQICVD